MEIHLKKSLWYLNQDHPPPPKKKVPDHGGGCSGRYQKEKKIDLTKLIQPIIKHTAKSSNMKWGRRYPVFWIFYHVKCPVFNKKKNHRAGKETIKYDPYIRKKKKIRQQKLPMRMTKCQINKKLQNYHYTYGHRTKEKLIAGS